MHLLKSPEDTCILFQLQIETPAAIFRCVFLISVFRFRRKTHLFFYDLFLLFYLWHFRALSVTQKLLGQFYLHLQDWYSIKSLYFCSWIRHFRFKILNIWLVFKDYYVHGISPKPVYKKDVWSIRLLATNSSWSREQTNI